MAAANYFILMIYEKPFRRTNNRKVRAIAREWMVKEEEQRKGLET